MASVNGQYAYARIIDANIKTNSGCTRMRAINVLVHCCFLRTFVHKLYFRFRQFFYDFLYLVCLILVEAGNVPSTISDSQIHTRAVGMCFFVELFFNFTLQKSLFKIHVIFDTWKAIFRTQVGELSKWETVVIIFIGVLNVFLVFFYVFLLGREWDRNSFVAAMQRLGAVRMLRKENLPFEDWQQSMKALKCLRNVTNQLKKK